MRILHVVQGYTPVIGGTEHLIQKISEQLVQRYGDEVTVFTTNAARDCSVFWLQSEPTLPAMTEMINGVTVRRFPVFNKLGHVRHQLSKFVDWAKLPCNDWFRAFFNGPLIFGMTKAIARFQADLVVASSFPFLHMHYALSGGKRSGKPVALCGALHTTDAWGFERPMIYKAIRQADSYIAYTQFEKKYLINRGVNPEKLTVIGGGVDLEQFAKADGQTVRAEYGWDDEAVVAYVGQLTRRKGVDRLLSAMSRVWERYPETKLLLAGSRGNYSTELEAQAAKFSAAQPNRIAIRYDFSEKEKADIFAAGDVVALPSTEESFGIVFLEAWACRKPVVGMGIGAVSSIISEGVDGLLAEPDDTRDLAETICRLLSHQDRRRQMGEAGYQKVKHNYTWDVITDKFRTVYRQVIRKHGDKS